MVVSVNSVPIHYEICGEGIPIICLHGYFVDSALMKGCLEPISLDNNNFQRIYVDLVGMGNTPASRKVDSTDALLSILISFIEQVIGEKSFLLFGESYGGYLSLALLQHFKLQAAGIFCLCPCVIADKEKRILPKRKIIENQSFDVSKEEQPLFEGFLEMAVIANEETWERYKKEIMSGIAKADAEYLTATLSSSYQLSDEASLKTTEFEKPAVFLLGKQDDMVGYVDTLKLQENFPRGTFAVIDGAGHNLQIEKPEIFSVFMREFLKNFV